ncbi:N-acetylmuramoyl-L-alanine amidase [Streptomyces galilaeus]|uniref:N-acetylmuramoyl-L-alanine amidase n=1 Tax=Streptomyces galilaeus TaxID=33899 RepID=A0ABW9IPW8_STRGJ
MTPAQLLAQLRKWGLRYVEYGNWKTHNRDDETGKPFGPVHGFMVHHTGSDSKDQRAVLRDGIEGLPGPLCHFGLAQDGTVYLIGWGRTNHAGSGDPDVLAAVKAENYGDNPPLDNQSIVDGNDCFYGVEIWYSGSHEMTDAQYAALRKLAAAVLDFHEWSEKSVIGHGEWGSPGKWDPGYASGRMMAMADVRADIRSTLAAVKPPVPTTPATPTVPAPKPSVPAKPKVSLKATMLAAERNPSAKGTPVTYAGVRTVEAALVKAGLLDRKLADGHYGTATVKAYAAWQRRCGYTGPAADGVPGLTSLRKLAAKYGFTVVA